MNSFILVAVISFLFVQVAFADIPAVVQIDKDGQVYHLIELVECKKGYWKYKCLDSEYPLVLDRSLYQKYCKALKTLPDNRPYNVKHPILQKVWVVANLASFALNILSVCKL